MVYANCQPNLHPIPNGRSVTLESNSGVTCNVCGTRTVRVIDMTGKLAEHILVSGKLTRRIDLDDPFPCAGCDKLIESLYLPCG